jgi:hypothetical protein
MESMLIVVACLIVAVVELCRAHAHKVKRKGRSLE